MGDYTRFKHVIEPRWTYTYLGELDLEQQTEIPLFDEVDSLTSTNSGRFALVNRVLAKPKNEKASAREIFLFELARALQLRLHAAAAAGVGPRAARRSPLRPARSRRWCGSTRPAASASSWRRSTTPCSADLASTGLSGNYGFGRGNSLGLTWFTRYTPENGETVGDQIRVFGGINLLPRKLRLEGQVNYDLEEKLLQQQRYILNWTAQCYGVRLELRDFRDRRGAAADQRQGLPLLAQPEERGDLPGPDQPQQLDHRAVIRICGRNDEGLDPVRGQGDAPAPADLHLGQAARAGRQQAGALLCHRGDRRGGHHRHRHHRRRNPCARSAPR